MQTAAPPPLSSPCLAALGVPLLVALPVKPARTDGRLYAFLPVSRRHRGRFGAPSLPAAGRDASHCPPKAPEPVIGHHDLIKQVRSLGRGRHRAATQGAGAALSTPGDDGEPEGPPRGAPVRRRVASQHLSARAWRAALRSSQKPPNGLSAPPALQAIGGAKAPSVPRLSGAVRRVQSGAGRSGRGCVVQGLRSRVGTWARICCPAPLS